MGRGKSNKSQENKTNRTLIIAAVITAVATLFAALISISPNFISSATSTPKPAVTPTATQTVVTITSTLEPTATKSTPGCIEAFCFLGKTIEPKNVRSDHAEFDFIDSALHIKGTKIDARVWFDNGDLPDNVRITVDFPPPDPNCIFAVGFGNGLSFRPSYHLTISKATLNFLRYRPDSSEERAKVYDTKTAPDFVLEANVIHQVQLERKSGNVSILSDDKSQIWIPQSDEEMQDISQLNRLFISANSNNQEPGCAVIIEKLNVEEITEK